MVPDGILQNALEYQRQLAGRPGAVLLGQLKHRILDDIERDMRIAHGIERLLVRAPFDLGEEIGQFLAGSQSARLLRDRA